MMIIPKDRGMTERRSRKCGGRAVGLLAGVLLLAGLFPAGAYDFGLTQDSIIRVSYDASQGFVPLYEQRDALWYRGDLGEWFTLEAEGSYLFYLKEEGGGAALDSHSFQADQLSLDGTVPLGDLAGRPAAMPVSLGRFTLADFTGKVLVHRVDGASMGLSRGQFSVSTAAGYTGLLPVNATTFMMTRSDRDALGAGRKLFPDRAPGRLLETVTLRASELFLRQSLTVTGVLHQDLRGEEELSANSGRAHTQYLGAGLSGPLGGDFFWKGWGYLNTGEVAGEDLLAFMTGGGVDWYLSQFLSSKIALKGLYASGDADYTEFYEGNGDGRAGAFLPITAGGAAQVFMPQYSNLFFVKASWGMKPLAAGGSARGQHLMVELSGGPFFRATSGPISADGLTADYSGLYLGSETDLSLRFRLFSDLGLTLSGGIFYPGAGFSDRNLQYKGKLGLSFGL